MLLVQLKNNNISINKKSVKCNNIFLTFNSLNLCFYLFKDVLIYNFLDKLLILVI